MGDILLPGELDTMSLAPKSAGEGLRTLVQPLIRKLEVFGPLTTEERRALCELPLQLRHCEAHENLVVRGEPPDGVLLVLSGFAIRYTRFPDGRRQIVGLMLPGDLCDIRIGLVRRMDHSVAALTSLVAGVIPTADLYLVMEKHARLARALWWASFVEESIAREWIVNVGYRSAYERLAHLLCEVYYRFEAVGLARDHVCDLPIRQSELADTLALSAVHVNRTLMELRRTGLMSLDHRRLTIHDMPGLRAAAAFHPGYLHLDSRDPPNGAPPLP
jgi:CRP-like cAMP-binding protein